MAEVLGALTLRKAGLRETRNPVSPYRGRVFWVYYKVRGKISKREGIIGALLIELSEVKEESEDLFTFGDDETLSALAFRVSHKPLLVNGRIYVVKT